MTDSETPSLQILQYVMDWLEDQASREAASENCSINIFTKIEQNESDKIDLSKVYRRRIDLSFYKYATAHSVLK